MTGNIKQQLKDEAASLGFHDLRCTALDESSDAGDHLDHFLSMGHHGDMQWMETHADRRRHPKALWPEAKTALVLAMSYTPKHDALAAVANKSASTISVYAQGKDYHDVVKPKLKQLARLLQALADCDVKVFVDTAPLMEKPLAEKAGLGWQGKHTNLVARGGGSWFFIGTILTTAELPPDPSEVDHCGHCTRCLDICPTNAFPKPYQLDARRCISYLTIEHKGHIPLAFRAAMGNRIYGCDDCLAVCPWNKFAVAAREQRFQARAETNNPQIQELLAMDDAAFRSRFRRTPVKRTGRDRMMRNILIAAGNSGDASLLAHITPHLNDASPLVRAMAVWALGELEDHAKVVACHSEAAAQEQDPGVLAEWHRVVGNQTISMHSGSLSTEA